MLNLVLRKDDNMDYKTDKILLNQEVERISGAFIAEDSIIIPDVKPDVLSIIDASANLYVYKKEISNNKLKIDGGIHLNTIYTADDEKNSTRAIHNTLDFSRAIEPKEKNLDNAYFSCLLNVRNIESKIVNGRKISVKASIEYEIIIYSNREIEYISQIDDSDVQKIGKAIDISTLKNHGETVCSAKERMSLEDNLADILSYNISVRNKEQKVSYNKILSKAECVIDLIYMNEENQIRSYQEIIPMMGFIDMPGVSNEELSVINYEARNISIRPDSESNNNVSVDIDFNVDCNLYETRAINVIEDLYSPEEEITLYQEEVNLFQNRNRLESSCEICEKINVSDAKDSKIYITQISRNNISQKISGESISFEGSINVDFLFESNITNRLEQRTQSIEFAHNVKADDINSNTELHTDFEIYNIECVSVQNGEYELKVGLNLFINKNSKIKTNLINNVKIDKIEQNKRQNSLIIYFVKEGDTLWKIAKRFKTTIEEIIEVNGIENENKLEVGEQLFIPRHVSKCTC